MAKRLLAALWFTALWTAYILLQAVMGCIRSLFLFAELGLVWLILWAAGIGLVYFCEASHAGTRFFSVGFAVLVVLDQTVKLFISSVPAGWSLNGFWGLLRIRPVRNTYNAAILNFFDVRVPATAVGVGKAAFLLLLIGLFLHYKRKYGGGRIFGLYAMLLTAGVVCSLLDTSVWGYSLDYLSVPTFFVADLKDVYLDLGSGALLLYAWEKGWFRWKKADRFKEK